MSFCTFTLAVAPRIPDSLRIKHTPSEAFFRQLHPVTLHDLCLDRYHVGKVLRVRLIEEVVALRSVINIAQDMHGNCIPLAIYATADRVERLIEQCQPDSGLHLLLANPYVKTSTDGGAAVRVDEANCVLFVPASSDVAMPNRTADELTPTPVTCDLHQPKAVCFNVGCSEPFSKRCAQCRVAGYCSGKCQKSHWKHHKLQCFPAPWWRREGRSRLVTLHEGYFGREELSKRQEEQLAWRAVRGQLPNNAGAVPSDHPYTQYNYLTPHAHVQKGAEGRMQLVATERLSAGTLVCCEVPLVHAPLQPASGGAKYQDPRGVIADHLQVYAESHERDVMFELIDVLSARPELKGVVFHFPPSRWVAVQESATKQGIAKKNGLLFTLDAPGLLLGIDDMLHLEAIARYNAFFSYTHSTLSAARALFTHSCLPNCTAQVMGSTLFVRTVRRIRKGEPLTVCMIDVDKPLLDRKEQLKRLWAMECKCDRCLLPTKGDLDTFPDFLQQLLQKARDALGRRDPTACRRACNTILTSAAFKKLSYSTPEKQHVYLAMFSALGALGELTRSAEFGRQSLECAMSFREFAPGRIVEVMVRTATAHGYAWVFLGKLEHQERFGKMVRQSLRAHRRIRGGGTALFLHFHKQHFDNLPEWTYLDVLNSAKKSPV